MKGEIDRDFYCSAGLFRDGDCGKSLFGCQTCRKDCGNYHRKHPTPEQFKEEYGREVPDDFPVWFIIPEDKNDNFPDWTLMTYADALQYEREEEEADSLPDMYIVCACTPFGKPDKDWRPQ